MRSEGYGKCRVCVCVCLSVKSHLTLKAFIHPENAATYSAGDKEKVVAFSLKLLRCRDRALPLLDGHTYDRPFFLWIARMRIVHMQVLQGFGCDARAPCHKLSLCSI